MKATGGPHRIVSNDQADALRDFWNAVDRMERQAQRTITLPCMTWPDMWYSDDKEQQADAATACHACPLQWECLAVAQASPKERWGIWAGKDYTNRVRS